MRLSEQTYILLSNLVFGYRQWADKLHTQRGNFDQEPNDDPGTYFATPFAQSNIQDLFKPFLTTLEEECDHRSISLYRLDYSTPLSYFGMAMMGEGGEFCNLLAKLERRKLGGADGGNSIKTEDITKEKLAEEIGGMLIYLAILAKRLDISLEDSAIKTFNEKSVKMQYPAMLSKKLLPSKLDECQCFMCQQARKGHTIDPESLDNCISPNRYVASEDDYQKEKARQEGITGGPETRHYH